MKNIPLITKSSVSSDQNIIIKKFNFLVCDDDPNITSSLKKLIGKNADKKGVIVNIDISSNGIECLNKIYDNYLSKMKYDILLIDENMPGIKGSMTIKIIKTMISMKELNPIKVFSITSFESEEFKKEMISIGCDGFIPKPVKMKDVEILFENFILNNLDM
ncbi:MAG: response regulator [Cyanobacteria bacterium]|nr:response regulator [Cyanobacteria bacterium CG_2015-04_32_10]